MYTRNVKIKLKANSLPEFTHLLESEIIPLLRKQKGFQDEITFVAASRNEAIAISFWNNQDDADASNHIAYLDVLRVLSKVVEALPIIETFEVGNSTSYQIAASAVNSGKSFRLGEGNPPSSDRHYPKAGGQVAG